MTTVHEGTYLVTGATGRTGSQVIRKLVQAGAHVRALIHSTQPEALPGEGVEFVPGDYQDYDSLFQACEGVDWVIATVGAQASTRGADLVDKVEFQGNVNLIDAAKSRGVRHFTLITVRGVGTSWAFNPVYVAKARAEQHLVESGVPYTIFRPGGIIDTSGRNFLAAIEQARKGEAIRVYGNPDQPVVLIFVDELAEFCIRAHIVSESQNHILELGGLPPFTRAEYWNLIGEIAGREAQVQYLSPDDLVPARQEAEKAENWGRFFNLAREEISARSERPAPDMSTLDRTFSVEQRDLETFIRSAAAQARND